MTYFNLLDNEVNNSSNDSEYSFDKFIKDKSYLNNTNLVFETLNNFIKRYEHQLGYDCGFLIKSENKSRYQLYLLVDISESKLNTMNSEMKRKYRKCGKERRQKLDEKYDYRINIMNRIHGYIVVEHSPGLSDDKTIAINIICSSNYSDVKGVGSYIMNMFINMSRKVGYKNIVLEVGSDAIEEDTIRSDVHDMEISDEEEINSESNLVNNNDKYSSDEYEYEYGSDSESNEEYNEEYNEYTQLIHDFSEYLSENLWKKSIRHRNNIPYYSFGEQYLMDIIIDNLENELTEQDLPEIYTDEQYGYGGYYYHKSKKHSKKLLEYYEKFNFKEDPKVHKEWKCFSELPFPSLRLEL